MMTTLVLATMPMMVAADSRFDAVLYWNDVTLRLIRAENTPPPLAARNLAMVHVAAYEALRNSADCPSAAVTVAAHRTLVGLYPRQADWLNLTLRRASNLEDPTPGEEVGREFATRVLRWRTGDDQLRRVGYRAKVGPGMWQPTWPTYKDPLLPGWSSAGGFALKTPDQFRPPPPPKLTSDEYAIAFREVQLLGSRESKVRTGDQTEVAFFWADGEGTVTPPGHWNQIAQTVSRSKRLGLRENARLFAALNMALADAGIACWDAKFTYDLWRPITAIREADQDGNDKTVPDPDWRPLLPTPPFPAYSSGHSTFSGAAAAVLKWFFGTDEVDFTTTSDGLRGVSRSFRRFSDAADEAGMSRIYGGIHYSFDNVEGLHCGAVVGDYVTRKFDSLTPVRVAWKPAPVIEWEYAE